MLLSMVTWAPPPHSPRKPKTFSVQIRCAPLKIARITLKLSRSLRQVKGFWLTHTTFAYSLLQAYCFPELSLGGFIFEVSNTPTNLTMSGSKIWIYSHTKNVSNYCVVSTFKQTKNEDDQQWRWPKMKTTKNEDDQKRRPTKTKTTKNEYDQKRRRPKAKTTKNEDDQIRGRPKTKTTENKDEQKRRRSKTKTTKNEDAQKLREKLGGYTCCA